MDITTEQGLRALVLDDDLTALRNLRRTLEARGFSVLCAADGERGVRILLDELLDLDVVVVDADLPGRDARSITHLVRHAGGERDLALVVLAADPRAAPCAELAALGVDAVVARSAAPDALVKAILNAIASRKPSAGGGRSLAAAVAGAVRAGLPRWAASLGRWSLSPA